MKIITINYKAYQILVDDEDYERVNQHTWTVYLRPDRKQSKPQIRSWIDGKIVYIHRFILNEYDENIIIDHKNRDRWDNQKENLRKLPKKNGLNVHNHFKPNKGIHFHSRDKVWQASISKDKRAYYLGQFDTREDAIKAYNLKASELYGNEAVLTPVDM